MGKEIFFEKVEGQNSFTLENQNGRMENISDIDIEYYLEDMFASPEQFVILTAPKAQYTVRYIQACMQGEAVEVELGIENNKTQLFYKLCSKQACYRIFLDFYDNVFIPEMSEYKPVQFL